MISFISIVTVIFHIFLFSSFPRLLNCFRNWEMLQQYFATKKFIHPSKKRKQNYLNFKKFGAKELPLPGAGQEDPDAVVAALALQRNPLLQQVVLQRLAILRVAVPGREEPVERLGNDVLRVARNRCRAGVLVRV